MQIKDKVMQNRHKAMQNRYKVMHIRNYYKRQLNTGKAIKQKELRSAYDYADGTITIEAAFIMPLIIYMIFCLIYLSFFLHDRCRIQAAVDQVLLKASITGKHDTDITSGEYDYEYINDRGVFYMFFGDTGEQKSRIENHLSEELSEGLFLCRARSIHAEVSVFKIRISVEYATQVTLPLFGHLFQRYSTIELEEFSAIHNPAETLRAAEVILEVGNSVKGAGELKEKVEEFLGGK